MKALKLFLFTFVSVLGYAVGAAPIVRYLDSYDQLYNFKGSDKLFYVRNAGGTRYGDPTVRSGWALYNWDSAFSNWRKISSYDLMSMTLIDFNSFLTRLEYTSDINPVKHQVISNVTDIASVKADNIILNGRVGTAESKIAMAGTSITNLQERMTSAEGGVTRLDADVESVKEDIEDHDDKITTLNGRITSLSNAVVEVDGKIDVNEAEIKSFAINLVSDAKIDIITNTAKRVRAVDAKIVATSNALDSAATVKANYAKAEANGYTDGKIKNLRSVMASGGNEAMIFNEADGGGTMMTLADGTKSFVGVNDASKSATGIAGQLYVVKGVNKTKINMYDDKFCYVKGDNPATDADKARRELVAKEDLDAASAAAAQALAAAFNLPITFTKGGVKYQLDVVDNGEDDITFKIIRVED